MLFCDCYKFSLCCDNLNYCSHFARLVHEKKTHMSACKSKHLLFEMLVSLEAKMVLERAHLGFTLDSSLEL